jgi:hypothetical protein
MEQIIKMKASSPQAGPACLFKTKRIEGMYRWGSWFKGLMAGVRE